MLNIDDETASKSDDEEEEEQKEEEELKIKLCMFLLRAECLYQRHLSALKSLRRDFKSCI